MKWTELATYLKFPLQCSCGETADNAERAFEHYRRGHILHRCPVCGGKISVPDVKGEYGAKDHSKYVCYKCWLEFDAKQIRTGLSREGGGGMMTNQWISVNDKMPERYPEEPGLSITVIVWAIEDENPANGFMAFACYSELAGDWLENAPLGDMRHTVTHWQPSPLPPSID